MVFQIKEKKEKINSRKEKNILIKKAAGKEQDRGLTLFLGKVY